MVLEGLQKLLFISKNPIERKVQKLLEKSDTTMPKSPNFLMKIMEMSYSLQPNKEMIAKEILKDKDLIARVLKISQNIKDLPKVSNDDFIRAIDAYEVQFLQNSIEIEIAHKYMMSMAHKIDAEMHMAMKMCLRTALIAKTIAIWSNYQHVEQAFTAGLLSQFTKLMMQAENPEAAKKARELMLQGSDEIQAELIAYGFDHAFLGIKLIQYYAMPSAMAEMFKSFKTPGKEKELTKIVKFAQYIAEAFLDKSQSPSKMWTKAQEYMNELNLEFTNNEWANKISFLFVKSLDFEILVLSDILV